MGADAAAAARSGRGGRRSRRGARRRAAVAAVPVRHRAPVGADRAVARRPDGLERAGIARPGRVCGYRGTRLRGAGERQPDRPGLRHPSRRVRPAEVPARARARRHDGRLRAHRRAGRRGGVAGPRPAARDRHVHVRARVPAVRVQPAVPVGRRGRRRLGVRAATADRIDQLRESARVLLRLAHRTHRRDDRRRAVASVRCWPLHDRRPRQCRLGCRLHDLAGAHQAPVVRARGRDCRLRRRTPRRSAVDDQHRRGLHRRRLAAGRVDRGDRRGRFGRGADPRIAVGDRPARVLAELRSRAAAHERLRFADPA